MGTQICGSTIRTDRLQRCFCVCGYSILFESVTEVDEFHSFVTNSQFIYREKMDESDFIPRFRHNWRTIRNRWHASLIRSFKSSGRSISGLRPLEKFHWRSICQTMAWNIPGFPQSLVDLWNPSCTFGYSKWFCDSFKKAQFSDIPSFG